MNVRCDHCSTTYRVDPLKVPAGGVRARCSKCQGVFFVAAEAPAAVVGAPVPAGLPEGGAAPWSAPAPAAARGPAEPPSGGAAARPPVSPFGAADPQGKARRLARALVSDIAVYHPERRDRSLEAGVLRQEFREEIRKSWEEYVEQVGEDIARNTPHFRDALNEILARGQRVF